jgi:hypothetical protein
MSLAVVSCTFGYNRSFEPSNPDIFYPHDKEDYYQKVDTLYKDLKGLGQLHVGETTFKQCKREFEKVCNVDRWDSYLHIDETIDLTEWFGYDVMRNKITEILGEDTYSIFPIHVDEYLKENSDIKQCKIDNYRIGDVYIGQVNCIFYKDILVAMTYNWNCEIYYKFIEKYGCGKGFEKHFEIDYIKFQKKLKDTEIVTYERHNERRVWSNNAITLEFISDYCYPDIKWVAPIHGQATIISNDMYNEFLEYLDICIKQCYENKLIEQEAEREKRQESLNQLF